nr:MAG TPA: hypothetical protein [Caudoviricetes sp.]
MGNFTLYIFRIAFLQSVRIGQSAHIFLNVQPFRLQTCK